MDENIEFKLKQSQYFLNSIKTNENNHEDFIFNLSAFFSSTYSVLDFLDKKMRVKLKSGFGLKDEEKDVISLFFIKRNSRDVDFFQNIRNEDIHREIIIKKIRKDITIKVPTLHINLKTGETKNLGEGSSSCKWYFRKKQGVEILDLCKEYLERITFLKELIK